MFVVLGAMAAFVGVGKIQADPPPPTASPNACIPEGPTYTVAPSLTPTSNGPEINTLTFHEGTWTTFSGECGTRVANYYYTFYRNFTTTVASGNSTSSASPTYPTVAGDVNQSIAAEVRVCDSAGNCTAVCNSTTWCDTIVNTGSYTPLWPTNTVKPTVTPSGTGQTVGTVYNTTANHGTWTGFSPITAYGYQWLRNGTAISGATNSSYTSVSADAGTTLTLEVRAENAHSWSPWVISSNSAQFVPFNTAAPTVSPGGTGLTVGSSVSTGNGSWSSVASTTYAYAWLRDGTVISGATGSSYTATSADISHCLTSKVTATNANGSSSVTSSSSTCVDNHLGPLGDNTYWSQPLDDRESLSVNVGDGNLVLSANDLELAGIAGFDLKFPRTYNSLYSSTQDLASSFPARGWQALASLHVASTGDVWYTAASGSEWVFVKNGSSYTPPAGLDATLTNLGGSYTLAFNTTSEKLSFNSSGVLLSDADRNGNTITYNRTAGQLTSITDSPGRTTSFTYNGSGQLTKITDMANRTYQYSYDASGNLASFTDPTGAITSYTYSASGLLVQVTDPRLNATKISYDTNNRVNSIQSGLDHTGACPPSSTCPLTTFSYGVSPGTFTACSTSTTNVTAPDQQPSGPATRYCLDNQIRVTGLQQPDGETAFTDYKSDKGGSNCTDASGNSLDDQPCSTTSGRGYVTTFGYDSTGKNLLWEQNPLQDASHRSTWVYGDSAHPYSPTGVTDANGYTTTYSYYPSGNIDVVTDPYLKTTTYTYYGNGELNQVTDRNTQTTSYTYDGNGNLASSTDPVGNVTLFGYDSAGNKTSQTDPLWTSLGSNPATKLNYTTTFSYDGYGRPLSETNELADTTTLGYDGNGNVLTDVEANGHETSYVYTSGNQLSSATSGLNASSGACDPSNQCPETQYAYDASGNQLSVVDPLQNTTSYGYDADNQMTTMTDSSTNITKYSYDGDGNLASVTDPLKHTTTYGYDAVNQQTSETQGLDGSSGTPACDSGDTCPQAAYGYDLVGHQTAITQGLNSSGSCPAGTICPRTATTYDKNNLVSTTTSGLQYDTATGVYDCLSNTTCPKTSYTYDNEGNVTKVTKPISGSTTSAVTNSYYGDGSLHTTTDPLGNVTTYNYDPNGNLETKIEPLGTISYGYDNANELQTLGYQNASGNNAPATLNVTYVYDSVGNRKSMTTGSTSVYYGYTNDEQPCLVSTTSISGCTGGSATFAYGYNADGNVSKRTYPDGTSTYYGYNPDDQLCLVATTSANGCGSNPTYTYYPDGSLNKTTGPNGDAETRTYYKTGWLQDTKTTNPTAGTVADVSYPSLDGMGNPQSVIRTGNVSCSFTYQYDNNERLAAANYQNCPIAGQPDSFSWTYDADGNWLSESQKSGTTTASTSYTPNAGDELTSSSASTGNYSYDGDGNETYDPVSGDSYQYDLENRLTAIKCCGTSPTSTIATYTYDGDGHMTSKTVSGTTTNYFWDTNTGGPPELALEKDGSGNLINRYIYGLSRVSSTDGGGNAEYYTYDGTGSVSNLVSASGSIDATYTYNPYGTLRQQTSSLSGAEMKFDGAQVDSAVSGSTLYDAGADNYDATTGRFLNPGAASGANGGLSNYALLGDEPAVLTTAADTSSSASGTSINRNGVATYAINYALPPHNPNYVYYSGGGAEGDCTNFVSQALYHGGWQQTSEWKYVKPSCLLPYIDCSGPTHSWTVVHDFLDFAIRQGRAYYASAWSTAMKGDVIAVWFTPQDQHASHLMVIDNTVGTPAEKTSGSIYISQHSHDRKNIRLWGPLSGTIQSSRRYAVEEFKAEPTFKLLHIR